MAVFVCECGNVFECINGAPVCDVCEEEREDNPEHEAGELTEADDEDKRRLALAKHDGGKPSDYEHDGNNVFSAGRREWLVLTDSEADEAWDEELERYWEDCVLPEVPAHLRGYMDAEAWKSDARHDGRGHSLSGYDGNEDEEDVDGVTYYIYRTN